MKITLSDVSSGYNLQNINENFERIQIELNDKVLYRDNPDGESNQLESDIDANSKRIYNLPAPYADNEAARLKDVRNAISGVDMANLIGVDPLTGFTGTTVQGVLQEMAAALGNQSEFNISSNQVAFTHYGVGAMATTIEAALRAGIPLRPVWFGADPTGNLDSTAALQLMATAATGPIDMRGNFKVNRSIIFTNKDNVTLTGPGTITADKNTWAFTPGYRGIIEFNNSTHCGVTGMTIVGVRKSNPAAFQPWEDGDSGVEILNGSDNFVRDCRIRNTMAWGVVGVATQRAMIIANYISDVTRQSGINVAVGGGEGYVVADNRVENVGLYGIEGETVDVSRGGRYRNNIIRDCQKGMALVSYNTDVVIEGHTIEGCLYGISVNNLSNYPTEMTTIRDNTLLKNWRGVELAGARETDVVRNTSTGITVDTYMHRSSYNSVHTVTGANTFTSINFLNDAATTPVASTLLLLGVEYTITNVATSTIAGYGAIKTFTVTPALPVGLSEGEMFKTRMLAVESCGFIGAAGNLNCNISDNVFTKAAYAYWVRGATAGCRLDNNHSIDCTTLMWFDTASVGGYRFKGNTHSGTVVNAHQGSLTSFSTNGDVEGRKAPLFFNTKAAAGLSRAYYPSSDTEFVFAITVSITDSSSTGSAVITLNAIDTVVINIGEYVASGVTQRTVYLATPIKLNANTIYMLNFTDTAGDLAFKHAHVTLHTI